MRKIVSFVLAMVLVLSMCMTVSAATIDKNSEQTATTTATYTKGEGYTVTIPADITVGGEAISISAADVMIDPGETLKVSVASANSWKVKNGEEALAYKLNDGTADIKADDTVVLSVAAGTATGSVDLTAELDNVTATKSGTYTDTLTFTVAVE